MIGVIGIIGIIGVGNEDKIFLWSIFTRIHEVIKFWEIIWHRENSPLIHLSILTNAIHSISRKSRLTLTLIRTKSICTRGVGMTWISITFVKIYAIKKENLIYDFEKISGIGKGGQESVKQITKLTTVKITLHSTLSPTQQLFNIYPQHIRTCAVSSIAFKSSTAYTLIRAESVGAICVWIAFRCV